MISCAAFKCRDAGIQKRLARERLSCCNPFRLQPFAPHYSLMRALNEQINGPPHVLPDRAVGGECQNNGSIDEWILQRRGRDLFICKLAGECDGGQYRKAMSASTRLF